MGDCREILVALENWYNDDVDDPADLMNVAMEMTTLPEDCAFEIANRAVELCKHTFAYDISAWNSFSYCIDGAIHAAANQAEISAVAKMAKWLGLDAYTLFTLIAEGIPSDCNEPSDFDGFMVMYNAAKAELDEQ